MSVSLEERRLGRIPDHPHDVLIGPLKHRCTNQQGNINGEFYLPKYVGNVKSKTNKTTLVLFCLRERDRGLVEALFTAKTAVLDAIKQSFSMGKTGDKLWITTIQIRG